MPGGAKEGIDSLNEKLFKNTGYKKRSLSMANHITNALQSDFKETLNPLHIPKHENAVKRLSRCGDWLVYNHYYTIDDLRLASADFCEKHLLCPFCASRRGSKAIRVYQPKVEQVLNENKKLKLFMVTMTVKNGAVLPERFNHLSKSIKFLMNRRKSHNSNPKKPYTEFCKASGGVYSIEVKKGQDSGLWHPHAHMIWICEEEPNAFALSKEWEAITGDSKIVDVREMSSGENQLKGFLEVFKYALKFSDMPLEDNFEAYLYLNGKRLVNPFGSLYGLKIPDNLADDLIDDLPYMELFYNFQKGSYNLTKTKHEKPKNEQV